MIISSSSDSGILHGMYFLWRKICVQYEFYSFPVLIVQLTVVSQASYYIMYIN